MFDAKLVSLFCLLGSSLCFAASEGVKEIRAKPGDDVVLQCQSLTEADITVLKWNREELKSDSFVFFFRGKRVYENYQHESYRGRVELKDPEMKNGDVSVILKNVNINDTGTYECYVGYGGTHDLININLRVEPGDNKDGGDEGGGDKRGHVGLIVGLLVVLLLVAVGGFVIYRKFKVKKQNSNPPAGEQTGETQMFQV
ncbi:coxsackievirus and adenovirus receptor homolog [Anabas testudineus]|uniref:coxsackievirus and adenovirus receptor homolog n=1 Tax=Anabas testudineus TaxID=64144 RepID=UPI000E45ECE0|nr:coxsackievirus and adenovirus receptor homolog [Anabas testudineus]